MTISTRICWKCLPYDPAKSKPGHHHTWEDRFCNKLTSPVSLNGDVPEGAGPSEDRYSNTHLSSDTNAQFQVIDNGDDNTARLLDPCHILSDLSCS